MTLSLSCRIVGRSVHSRPPFVLIYWTHHTYLHTIQVHTTPDCYGGMRLGPFERWLPDTRDPKHDVNHPENRNNYIGSGEIDMSVSADLRQTFVDSVRYFLPFLDPEGITPDTSGIHPKLQSESEGMRDWVSSMRDDLMELVDRL